MSSPICVIPARYASTRFPGKPLALIAGRPMLEHVHRACIASGAFSRVVIATDDQRIADVATQFGARVQLTSPDCATGTDRVAEVARAFPDDVFINVQGDEPVIDPAALNLLATAFNEPAVNMATLVRALDGAERANPNVVKAVLALNGDALYFSRHDVPFDRAPAKARWAHVGLYGYRRDTLLQLSRLPVSPLEDAEKLEQLRALENGIRIRCLVTTYRSVGVDTPEDLITAERLLDRR